MRRRLVIAIAGAVAAGVIIVGLGTLALTAVDARRRIQADLARQVGELAVVFAEVPPLRVAPLAGRLEGALDVTEAAAAPLETVAAMFGPDAAARLLSGETVSERSGGVARAAAPLLPGGVGAPRRALVITVSVGSGVDAAARWFVVAGIGTVLLGGLIAWRMARSLADPLARAEAATQRIAAGDLAVRVPEPYRAGGEDELAGLTGAINEMAASLERSRAMEREFLLSVSHDLRTPLTAISGWAEALADGAATDPSRTGTIILSEARRLDRLVADLLDLARIRVHAFGLGHRPVDLGEVVAGTAEGLRPDLEEAGLSLLVETPPAPVLVSGDPDRIAQIAANLIDNAGRYAARQVLARVAAAAPVVTLDVADDGPGIPPRDRTAVFERTFVAGRPAARSSPGSGLGLAIVRELAAAMGAEVSVTDGIDGGARLVVSFPILDPRA